MSIKKLKTILPAALNKIRPGSTFLSVMNYTNNYGELSNFGLVFHADYRKAVRDAVSIWLNYRARNDIEAIAKEQLIKSYCDTLIGYSHSKVAHIYSGIVDNEDKIINGVKYHDRAGVVHLHGFLVHKRILKPALYPSDTRKELTKAKDRLRDMTRLGKFRQFRLTDTSFKKISVEKLNMTHHDLLRNL